MLSCFDSDFKVTQEFGVNKKFYSKYGMRGHNGIDIIPVGANWTVKSVFGGKIVRAYFNDSYGWRVAIWNKKMGIWECHNHLEYIDKSIKYGEEINPGITIGKMGNSGESFGAHNHFQIGKCDANGYLMNENNGYLGYVDPLPYLKKGGQHGL